MPAVQIRDVSSQVIAALKRRAARHERSLEGELRYILTSIAREEPSGQSLPPIDLKLSQASPATTWRREEIYEQEGEEGARTLADFRLGSPPTRVLPGSLVATRAPLATETAGLTINNSRSDCSGSR